MLRVGSKFDTFDELSQRLEEFQKIERVQLWVRDSRTVIAAAKRARRKSLNPALKYAELTYSCVFGGRRPSDQSKVHNQTSAGGCPFKVRLSTSGDGQSLIVKEICHNHNHEPGKKLHDEPRRLYKKTHNSRAAQEAQESYSVNSSTGVTSNATIGNSNKQQPIKLIVSKHRLNNAGSPFANLQQLQQQQQQQHNHQHNNHQQQHHQQPQPLKLHLHTTVQHQAHQPCYIKKEIPDQLTDVDIGSTLVDTPDHMYSMDYETAFPYNTPSTCTPSGGSLSNTPGSSMANTPNNSPNTSPTNSLSSGPEEPVHAFNLPPSPISPSTMSTPCPMDGEEDRLEPLYDLSEALEGGLASLPSVDSEDSSPMYDMMTKSSASGGPVPSRTVAITTTMHNTQQHQLPVVRTVSASNGVRLSYPISNTCNNTVYKPRTITASSNRSIYFNTTDGGLVKAVKPVSGSSNTASVQYNVVSSKFVGTTGGSGGSAVTSSNLVGGAKVPGKITIQQYLSSSTALPTATYSSTTATTNKGTSNLLSGVVNSCPSPVIVGLSSGVSCSSGAGAVVSSSGGGNTATTTLACSLVNASSMASGGGAVRNYRAKIAKKPYGSGGILKVVRSDEISNPKTYESVDRLINTVAPNKVNIVEVNKSSINNNTYHEREAPLAPSRNLYTVSTNNVFENDTGCFGSEIDRVISGGLEVDKKIKSELVEGAAEFTNYSPGSCDDHTGLNFVGNSYDKSFFDSIIGGNIKEEPILDLDLDSELNALYVLDGIDDSALCGDIPITPDSLFDVSDMDGYDIQIF